MPSLGREAAALHGMTAQTFPAKVSCRLYASQLNMGVVARDAAQSAIALDGAAAHLQLFRMAERSDDINLGRHWRAEDGNHVIERRPRPEIQVGLAGPEDLGIPKEMALFANIIAEVRRQASRINDRKINGTTERTILSTFADVKFSGPMASFTANAKKTEGRYLIPVSRAENGKRQTGVTGSTQIPDGTREA